MSLGREINVSVRISHAVVYYVADEKRVFIIGDVRERRGALWPSSRARRIAKRVPSSVPRFSPPRPYRHPPDECTRTYGRIQQPPRSEPRWLPRLEGPVVGFRFIEGVNTDDVTQHTLRADDRRFCLRNRRKDNFPEGGGSRRPVQVARLLVIIIIIIYARKLSFGKRRRRARSFYCSAINVPLKIR